jgi:dienelactone hydrolase
MRFTPKYFLWFLGCLAASAHADPRADFLKLIDRPRVPLAPHTEIVPATNGLVEQKFSYAAEASQRVPGILFKSETSRGRRPVVIVLHGTTGSKNSVLPALHNLAQHGFVAVAIDGRYHGERCRAGKGSEDYQAAILRAWHGSGEHPFYYDTVWDVLRLIDYLETRDDVDASRIGLSGVSKGGIETYFAAAIDPRIAVAIPIIGVQSFRWGLEHDAWQGRVGTIPEVFAAITQETGAKEPDAALVRKFYDRVVPGIYGEFDGPSLLPLIAPRPLLVINGDIDPHTPLPGVKECAAAAEQAYHATGADEKFALRIEEHTGHRLQPDAEHAALEWFIRWLKP